MKGEPNVEVNGFEMGPGTPYCVVTFNPLRRVVRATSQTPRAWAHGDWSGAEWQESPVVTGQVALRADDTCPLDERLDRWMELQQQMSAAFAARGAQPFESELIYRIGTRRYLMYGRPRMQEPNTEVLFWSASGVIEWAFVALDPLTYSADETEVTFGLARYEGGLTVPFTVPFVVAGVQIGGSTAVVNEGTTPVGMTLRIDGPVVEPRVTVQRPDGGVDVMRVELELGANQWLLVDTVAQTVFLNGDPGASRRGYVSGVLPMLQPGESVVRFTSSEFNDQAALTVRFRSAWR